jgi:hypothetical protein
MKLYLNVYNDGGAYVHNTPSVASENADGAYLIAYEVEVPDPPHEWKVGDWFTQPTNDRPRRIVDITPLGKVAYHLRGSDGEPRVWITRLRDLASADPCDPPVWFTDGAS